MKRTFVSLILALGVLLATGPAPAARHHHRRRHHGTAKPLYSWESDAPDVSPVLVEPYLLPTGTDPWRAGFLRRMHLEDGVLVRDTRRITRRDVDSRDLFILDITQSLEGGFDSVNMYDRGVLSWGLMQWTARTGRLTQALVFIKRRLWATRRKRVWDKVFVANGLDADPDGLIVYGRRLRTPQDVRLAFRGTMRIGKGDSKLMTHWATVMARAGRQPAVAALEVEYAGRTVDAMLDQRLEDLPYHAPGRAGVTVADLASNDPYSEALVFALWTNNPRHAVSYVEQAARAARGVSEGEDPSLGSQAHSAMPFCASVTAHASATGSRGQPSLKPVPRPYTVRTFRN